MTDDLFKGYGVQIELVTDLDFLKVKETLTRIGIASKQSNTLWQSCHILHKRGKYAILHFKELFALDGRPSSISDDDIGRRNRIVQLLEQWNLVRVVSPLDSSLIAPLSTIKVVKFTEKADWDLKTKYLIGKKKSGT